jgi:hypothetical protein
MKSENALPNVIEQLRCALQQDEFWNAYLAGITSSFGIHLAIFNEPYLRYLLDGTKTVESRFSVNRCPPYNRVVSGDLLLLKRAGGPIVGVCFVNSVSSYELDPRSWQHIRREYTTALCAQDPEFWTSRAAAGFATLMHVKNARPVSPLHYPKRDRRGWVVLQTSSQTLTLQAI